MAGPSPRRRVAARLARMSFQDGARAGSVLADEPLHWWDLDANSPASDAAGVVVAALARSADPDAALSAVAQIAVGAHDAREALETDSAVRARLLALLGASGELAQHLVDHPADWTAVRDDFDLHDAPARLWTAGSGTTEDRVAHLRRAYRREVIAIAGRDLAGDLDLREVTGRLADLAGATLQAALTIAAADLPQDASACRLAVIAMGKTGGCELNYVSDVDVIFVAEPDGAADPEAALTSATRLASELIRICRVVAWQVDANLRPEGKDGPLVRTLASHEAYYRRWASTWEFQALLKARPVAGDPDLGAAYVAKMLPMVWAAAERPDFVADVRAMRRRVLEHIPAPIVERDIKLGRGGLRDVEFAVQLLQLVHGRADESLRVPGTLPALEALRDGGYVGRDDAVSLADAYRFLRAVEHRLQLRQLRRTHVLPDDDESLSWLARAMGFRPDRRGTAREVFQAEWDLHAREVRRLHEKLFYRPLLEAVARVPTDALRLTTAQAAQRLAALGFVDPDAALRHIESLTAGVSRRAALQRTLLPVLLADFADAPDPDRGLLAYRRLSEELGSTPWYLRLLRDGDAVAPRLAQVLGTSRYVARMLGRAPDALPLLSSLAELAPREPAEIARTMHDIVQRRGEATSRDETAAAVAALRAVRRQELLRTAFADLLVRPDVEQTCHALSATVDATLEAALQVAVHATAAQHGLAQLPIRFTVVAMGRLGGAEVGYGSDADVIFVHESMDDTGADEQQASALARDVARLLTTLLGSPSSSDPPLVLDADLRPEGRSGSLSRSLASYERYYARWSSAWEAQALLRARPVAGDAELGRRFVELIEPVRYPRTGLSSDDLREIRRLKSRVDTERLPRGADPSTHTKLGRGGLADIEWTVQLLQMSHGAQVPELRTTRTVPALNAAASAGLLSEDQVERLSAAWQLATRVRNAIMLVRDKPGDQVPGAGADLVAVARVLGYGPGADPGQLVDDYRRAARRARSVVEAVFYGA